ncbi:MAG: hypothetical protein II703_01545, partial [Ruminococcus sp.]|nr:hypothetical protein [Ruminococcus sp.]
MKKILTLITCLLVFAGVFTGCGSSSASSSDSKKISIVTTIFPEYDWVKNIIGDREKNVELTMLSALPERAVVRQVAGCACDDVRVSLPGHAPDRDVLR